jgi:anti-anti-sigma factor
MSIDRDGPAASWDAPSGKRLTARTAAFAQGPAGFTIAAFDEAGVRVIAVKGEIDTTTAPQLEAHLQDAQARAGAVLADLSAVHFIDSTAVRSLWSGHNAITGQARRFAVALSVAGAPMRVIQLTGLDKLLTLYPDRVTAIGALRGGG